MKTSSVCPLLVALALISGSHLAAANAASTPGFRVVTQIVLDENGKAESEQVIASEDFTGEHILDQVALKLAAQVTQAPREVDGKKVKYKVDVPFDFPVEDDEGAASNQGPRPSIRTAKQPIYPANLGAQDVAGGVIMEIVVASDGSVRSSRVLRASHPEFAQAVEAALPLWTFAPAVLNGDPVESRWRLALAFATDDKVPDWKWQVAPRPSLGAYKIVHSKIAAQAPKPTTPAPASPEPAGK